MGGTPASTSAGKLRKLPPPATLFIAPARNAAPMGSKLAACSAFLAFSDAIHATYAAQARDFSKNLAQVIEIANLHGEACDRRAIATNARGDRTNRRFELGE